MSADLTLALDAAPVSAALAGLSTLAEKLAPEFVDRLVGALDAGAQFFRVETDGLAAAGAGKLVMRAQPSDLLLAFVAAAGAADSDLGAVERALCHLESSAVGHDAAISRGCPA